MTTETNAIARYNATAAPYDRIDDRYYLVKFAELKKELAKCGVVFRYLDYMGQWFDGRVYIESHSWDEITESTPMKPTYHTSSHMIYYYLGRSVESSLYGFRTIYTIM